VAIIVLPHTVMQKKSLTCCPNFDAEDHMFQNIFVRMVCNRLSLRIKFLVHYTITINKTDNVHLQITLKCICDIIAAVEKQ